MVAVVVSLLSACFSVGFEELFSDRGRVYYLQPFFHRVNSQASINTGKISASITHDTKPYLGFGLSHSDLEPSGAERSRVEPSRAERSEAERSRVEPSGAGLSRASPRFTPATAGVAPSRHSVWQPRQSWRPLQEQTREVVQVQLRQSWRPRRW